MVSVLQKIFCNIYYLQISTDAFNLDQSAFFLFVNPFPNDKFCTLPNRKSLQTTIANLKKMAESSQNEQKKMWQKEKLLVTSNFSFSHIVFQRLVQQTRKSQGMFGKGLKNPVFHC